MWRKLLLVCIYAVCSCTLAHADAAGHARRDEGRFAEGVTHSDSTIPSPANRRLALVIGNERYENEPLANPVSDARAMSHALQARGFDVMLLENLTRQGMTHALDQFRRSLEHGGTAVLYFAGHGFQLVDKTVLAPVDGDSRAPASLIRNGIDLQEVLGLMAQPRPGKLNIVLLDICLHNPFGTGTTKFATTADQTIVAFGASPGALASDGVQHGLYTAALLGAMRDADADLVTVLQRAEARVRHASGGRQLPWSISTLHETAGTAHTVPRQEVEQRLPFLTAMSTEEELDQNTAVMPPSRAILPKDSAEQYELSFWDSIKDSNHIGDFEAYLQAYPNGRFAALAKARIERLRAAARKTETPKEEARTPAAPAATPPSAAPAPKTRPEKPRASALPKPAPEQARPAPSTAPPAPAAEPRPAPAAGSEIKDCPACPSMVTLRPGSFTMGSNSGDPTEKPAHQVAIGAPFAIGKTEVTVEQWNACVEAGACTALSTEAGSARNLPARDISWDDAQGYVKWLTKTTGQPYRLPSEAEWEYAARGGTATRHWWGEQMKTGNANCKECGSPWEQKKPAPVASFAANPYGLHDMNGSVWEWVGDCWHTSYKGAPADGHAWDTPNCRERVIRGGSWREGASYMPSTTRFKYAASVRDAQNGFRVVKEMK